MSISQRQERKEATAASLSFIGARFATIGKPCVNAYRLAAKMSSPPFSQCHMMPMRHD
jgi:hypothetical protein